MILYASRDPFTNKEELFGDNFMILKCLGKLNDPAELTDSAARIYSRIFENMMSEVEAIKTKAAKALKVVIENGYQFYESVEVA